MNTIKDWAFVQLRGPRFLLGSQWKSCVCVQNHLLQTNKTPIPCRFFFFVCLALLGLIAFLWEEVFCPFTLQLQNFIFYRFLLLHRKLLLFSWKGFTLPAGANTEDLTKFTILYYWFCENPLLAFNFCLDNRLVDWSWVAWTLFVNLQLFKQFLHLQEKIIIN